MMKNNNVSKLDLTQMQLRTLDESLDAQRVSIVGQELNIDTDKLRSAIIDSFKDIKIEASLPQQTQSSNIQVIEIPTIIRETIVERIEVPVIVYESKIIEVPVMVPELKIVEIEKPIVVTEVKIVEIIKENFNKSFLYFNMGLTVLNILMLLHVLIK